MGALVVVVGLAKSLRVCTWYCKYTSLCRKLVLRLTGSIDKIISILRNTSVALINPLFWDVAIIIFQVINAPFRPSRCIDALKP